jgi:hypothetical protein
MIIESAVATSTLSTSTQHQQQQRMRDNVDIKQTSLNKQRFVQSRQRRRCSQRQARHRRRRRPHRTGRRRRPSSPRPTPTTFLRCVPVFCLFAFRTLVLLINGTFSLRLASCFKSFATNSHRKYREKPICDVFVLRQPRAERTRAQAESVQFDAKAPGRSPHLTKAGSAAAASSSSQPPTGVLQVPLLLLIRKLTMRGYVCCCRSGGYFWWFVVNS